MSTQAVISSLEIWKWIISRFEQAIKTMIVTNNERALELIEDSNYYMRSCWECNSSHTHLKDRKELFLCFACGKWWMNGDYLTDNEQHCNSEFKTSN